MKDSYACPGHEGKCLFCKEENGRPQYVGDMIIVDRVTGKIKVDPCCKACANNLAHQKKFYERTSIS